MQVRQRLLASPLIIFNLSLHEPVSSLPRPAITSLSDPPEPHLLRVPQRPSTLGELNVCGMELEM